MAEKDAEISTLLEKVNDSTADPVLKETLNFLLKDNSLKSSTINELQNEVLSLKTKVNELERYQSKDSVIIYNLPRQSSQVMDDVLRFFNNQLKVSVSSCDIKACHPLSKMQDARRPPPIIVKFIYFNQKERVFARKNS